MEEKKYIVDKSTEVRFMNEDVTILKTFKGRFLLRGKNISFGVEDIILLFETPKRFWIF